MKRIAAWLMMLILLFAAGCGVVSGDASSPETGGVLTDTERSATNALPPVTAAPPETIRYVVETDVREEIISTEDGIRLAEVRYQIPLLRAVDGDGTVIAEAVTEAQKRALEVTAAFNEKFDIWRQNDGSLEEIARSAYDFDPEAFLMGNAYADELRFSTWQTERLVSIRGESYSYYGGAHPNTVLLAWNFDLESGTYINPLSMGQDEQEFRVLVAEELATLAEERAQELQQEPADMYWEDYRTILMDWSEYAASFDTAGMTVCFSPYELGSYATGAHEFTISYAFLEPYLNDYGKALLGLTV